MGTCLSQGRDTSSHVIRPDEVRQPSRSEQGLPLSASRDSEEAGGPLAQSPKDENEDFLLARRLADRDAQMFADAALAARMASEEMRPLHGAVADSACIDGAHGLPDAFTASQAAAHIRYAKAGTGTDTSMQHALLLSPEVAFVKRLMKTSPASECAICLDGFQPEDAFFSRPCFHVFCKSCMVRHVSEETEKAVYPIGCPSCNSPLDDQKCLSLLWNSSRMHEKLQTIILERKHHTRIAYCANVKCATPFDIEPDPKPIFPSKVTCPLCNANTCIDCKTLWHEDTGCSEYLKRKETEILSELMKKTRWKNCPRCSHLIERKQGGCNFVRCRCGCGFCYRCGMEYLSLQQTALNQHGNPQCRCGLFDVPRERT